MEEAYFQRLERKEILEERLRDVKELKVRVVQCKEVKHLVFLPCGDFTPLLAAFERIYAVQLCGREGGRAVS